jgi:DNA-binding transcriptional regulator PaaX
MEENEDYKKRVKDLIDRVEKGENSPEAYRQLLEKIEQIKRSAISKINKASRNEKVIIGFVYILREYYWLRDNPKYPFGKDHILEEIDALYKLIYKELQKPDPYLPDRWDIDEKKRIFSNIREVLGTENMDYFCKKHNIRKVVGLKLDMRKGYECYLCCWIIAFIILLIIFFAQRL